MASDAAAAMDVDAAPRPPAASPQYNYVVSAQQATAVTQAAVGHFTGAGDVNLVLG
jgi:hypothetical protein